MTTVVTVNAADNSSSVADEIVASVIKSTKVRKERVKKEKPVRTVPAHMSKIEKIAAQLPELDDVTQLIFDDANNLTTSNLNALVAHINVVIRRRGVSSCCESTEKPVVGQRVAIVSGDAKFIGKQGTVVKVQRIRCYVQLDSRDKEDYFFISDVVALAASEDELNDALDLSSDEEDEEETTESVTSDGETELADDLSTIADEEEVAQEEVTDEAIAS